MDSQELQKLKNQFDIVGADPSLNLSLETAVKFAPTDLPVLITGESGVGKENIARIIHQYSLRRGAKFIPVNCGGIPEGTINSELFGHVRGAFTGATESRAGYFEEAAKGTIFLDEIGEMPLDLQVKLLRVVEQKQFMRLGGSHIINVDVRIISATNVDIREMIRQKRFREDLFFRLSTMRLHLMPLRERPGDIVPLAQHFVQRISERIGRVDIMRITPDAKELLTGMPWYGNVRELQNLIECIVQLYPDDRITKRIVLDNTVIPYDPPTGEEETEQAPSAPEPPQAPVRREIKSEPHLPAGAGDVDDNSDCRALTREDILNAIAYCGGNKTKAARFLGVSRRTFYRRLEEFGI